MQTASVEGTTLGASGSQLQLELAHAEQLLKGINIPPRPSILVAVLNEQGQPDPDLGRIAELIGLDVALAAGTLKVVNSPFFGLRRRIASIHHAVRLLGVGNVVNIVTGLMLHEAFKDMRSRFMDAFWTSSSQVAMVAALVAREHGGAPADEAYAAGLLSDCGAPMLMRRYPDTYEAIYREAMEAPNQTSTAYENEQLGTNHALVGYLVARSWQLPKTICECIVHHHDVRDHYTHLEAGQEQTVTTLALLKLAQTIHRHLMGHPPEYEWSLIGEAVLAHLGMDEADVEALRHQVEQVGS